MNIWIVTTGNSDVQLKSDYNSNQWNQLSRKVKGQFYGHTFEPSRPNGAGGTDPWTVPARVMGLVYSQQLDDVIYNDLYFPLLDTFTQYLKGKHTPDKIFVILTNQENIFAESQNRKNNKCPYWQDTCTLRPIFEKYFQKTLPQIKSENIEYLELNPNFQDGGLDNWDKSFILVRHKIAALPFNKTPKIYVSHQAGTPAISSATQFATLEKFREQVSFLVSNEYEKGQPLLIPSSTYLKGIKLQEAKALLERFDYSGVKDLFSNLWKNQEEPLNPQEQQIINLLNMAIQWNSAKFKNFGQARGKKAQQRLQNWWWTGYEAAYLAVVRLEQDNTVEALFHSFRAVEGLIRAKAGQTKDTLYELIPKIFPDWKFNADMKVFNDNTRDKRNNLFHQLLGMEEAEVFKAWDTNNNSQWQSRVLGCLNFVSGEKFTSLKKASLMFDVHQELEAAINNYELKNS